jgi:hypothetical protein
MNLMKCLELKQQTNLLADSVKDVYLTAEHGFPPPQPLIAVWRDKAHRIETGI